MHYSKLWNTGSAMITDYYFLTVKRGKQQTFPKKSWYMRNTIQTLLTSKTKESKIFQSQNLCLSHTFYFLFIYLFLSSGKSYVRRICFSDVISNITYTLSTLQIQLQHLHLWFTINYSFFFFFNVPFVGKTIYLNE